MIYIVTNAVDIRCEYTIGFEEKKRNSKCEYCGIH